MDNTRIKKLTMCAMLIAIGVVLSFLRIPISQITEITLTGLPIAAAGFMFGPLSAAAVGALIDVAGFLVRPMGPYFPGFTISNALIGVIYGAFLWQLKWGSDKMREQHPLLASDRGLLARIALSHLIKTLFVSLLLNCVWLSFFYGMPFKAVIIGSIPKEAINFPIEVALIFTVLKIIQKIKPMERQI